MTQYVLVLFAYPVEFTSLDDYVNSNSRYFSTKREKQTNKQTKTRSKQVSKTALNGDGEDGERPFHEE